MMILDSGLLFGATLNVDAVYSNRRLCACVCGCSLCEQCRVSNTRHQRHRALTASTLTTMTTSAIKSGYMSINWKTWLLPAALGPWTSSKSNMLYTRCPWLLVRPYEQRRCMLNADYLLPCFEHSAWSPHPGSSSDTETLVCSFMLD